MQLCWLFDNKQYVEPQGHRSVLSFTQQVTARVVSDVSPIETRAIISYEQLTRLINLFRNWHC